VKLTEALLRVWSAAEKLLESSPLHYVEGLHELDGQIDRCYYSKETIKERPIKTYVNKKARWRNKVPGSVSSESRVRCPSGPEKTPSLTPLYHNFSEGLSSHVFT
jgi:hypothetical protein